jgi:monothiol glutaredoxin
MKAARVAHELVDVRSRQEFNIARISGARLLDAGYRDHLVSLPRCTNVVFMCHHGIRSQSAAEEFCKLGFRNVFNLEGGIDAWSKLVDNSVQRY